MYAITGITGQIGGVAATALLNGGKQVRQLVTLNFRKRIGVGRVFTIGSSAGLGHRTEAHATDARRARRELQRHERATRVTPHPLRKA
jgi:nucleoside-diphosphate-sugar epimerase